MPLYREETQALIGSGRRFCFTRMGSTGGAYLTAFEDGTAKVVHFDESAESPPMVLPIFPSIAAAEDYLAIEGYEEGHYTPHGFRRADGKPSHRCLCPLVIVDRKEIT